MAASHSGIPNYSVVKGHAVEGRVFPPRDPTRDQPHYHIHIQSGAASFDVAVNVLSTDDSQVLFHLNSTFQPPNESALLALTPGLRAITPAGAGGLGLDFIREHLVTLEQMDLLDITDSLPGKPMERVLAQAMATPLHSSLDALVQAAIAGQDAEIYAFGSMFRNSDTNPFFGFTPDIGVHDIHMNQGNPGNGSFAKDNGTFQDGALFFRFPGDSNWQAVFIAFQSQSWNTDSHGRPIPTSGPPPPPTGG